jgi:lipid A ethanolaminephosphotransferase
MIYYFVFFTIIPTILILKTSIIFPKKYFLKSLKIILICLIIGLGFGFSKYQTIHRAVNLSRKKIIYTLLPVNYIRSSFSVLIYSLKPYFRNQIKQIEVSGTITSPENLVVVLAIGETSRQKNFSLYGYNRQTNPLLSQ